jgi:hypothetical protein
MSGLEKRGMLEVGGQLGGGERFEREISAHQQHTHPLPTGTMMFCMTTPGRKRRAD